jgi:hypothetical protein
MLFIFMTHSCLEPIRKRPTILRDRFLNSLGKGDGGILHPGTLPA